ncbi:MAG: 50S ribosomal protein L11 methyltransferase [Bacteroidales bacterium]|jgi:ribosomal protein L11 methyltransferase|nr:50S ribosomal protein L11 methyltransferase [Bacteroidales bacterium]
MHYIEAICILPENGEQADISDIVVALLAELGYESFETTGNTVKAYIRNDLYDAAALTELAEAYPALMSAVSAKEVPQENWNRLWESNFQMTVISDRCVVYAPFHTNLPDLPCKICILPQMSFGTGHHETTSMMLELLLDADTTGKQVLDMGCGTGILAILASIKGAKSVFAVDIDEWAYNNAIENCERNKVTNVEVRQGDKKMLQGKSFDLILANINRNILLEDMTAYAACLKKGGSLILSGFYADDFQDITREAGKNGFTYVRHKTRKNWVAAEFVN